MLLIFLKIIILSNLMNLYLFLHLNFNLITIFILLFHTEKVMILSIIILFQVLPLHYFLYSNKFFDFFYLVLHKVNMVLGLVSIFLSIFSILLIFIKLFHLACFSLFGYLEYLTIIFVHRILLHFRFGFKVLQYSL